MTDEAFSVAQAKAQFAELLNQAEAGRTVRITRRGKPVAVVLSEAEFERLKKPTGGWVAFTKAWRKSMIGEGLPLLSDAELSDLRNRQERAPAQRRRHSARRR